ncbi:MAG: VOC family protein [bacterium]
MFQQPMLFVATTRPEAALAFYRDQLGFTLQADTPFAAVLDADGFALRLQKVPHHTPPQHTVLGWQVASIEATMATLASRGVPFLTFPGLGQDAHGVWTTPDGARVCWFADPDGNTLSLTELAAV